MSTYKHVTVATLLGLAGVVGVIATAQVASAQANSQLTQNITAGVLSTNFTDGTGATIGAPSFAMSAVTISTTGNMTSTGTYASASQRATVDNPGASASFNLSIAATTPAVGWYKDGTPAVSVYKHNGATAAEGQLSITSAGTVGAYTGGTTGIAPGTPATFTGTTPISIMTGAAGTMSSVWRGYVQGVGLSQVIPQGTPAASYSIDLTQTVTAS